MLVHVSLSIETLLMASFAHARPSVSKEGMGVGSACIFILNLFRNVEVHWV